MEHTFICCGQSLTIYPISVVLVKKEYVLKGWTLEGRVAQLPLKGITGFDKQKVTETILIRPLSFPINDFVATRLKIELNGNEAVTRIEVG
jgi:hypothetical protein